MAAVTKLFCIGNPLLDVSAEVDQALLDKYDVKLNNAILAEDKHLPVFEELVANFKVQYIAGGATQNSARVAQWQVNVPGAVTYTGCIGKDSFGEKLKEAAKADGLTTPYYEIDTTPTGKCAVLVVGTERSLIAHLAAAEQYKIEWTQTPAIQAAIADAGIYYIAGFVLTHSADSILHVAKHAAENNKVFSMNTSAPFLFQVPPFFAAFKEAWEYIDILFGNESEAAAMVRTPPESPFPPIWNPSHKFPFSRCMAGSLRKETRPRRRRPSRSRRSASSALRQLRRRRPPLIASSPRHSLLSTPVRTGAGAARAARRRPPAGDGVRGGGLGARHRARRVGPAQEERVAPAHRRHHPGAQGF